MLIDEKNEEVKPRGKCVQASHYCTEKCRTFVESLNEMITPKEERIELRVSAEDKSTFLRAQKVSGDKSFSSFMVRVLRKHAEEILAQHDRVLATERDRNVFFDAVFGSVEPNEALRSAAVRYHAKKSNR